MSIYHYIFIFLIFFSVLEYLNPQKMINKLFIIPCTLGLIFIAGFRFNCGFDFWDYKLVFDTIFDTNITDNTSVEPLFNLIIRSIRNIGLEYSSLIFLSALFSVGLKIKFFNKYSPFVFLSILLYFSRTYLVIDMGQFRQGIALTIILWAISYLLDSKKYKFLILVLVASFIHSSAIIALLFYFVINLKLRKSTYLNVLAGSFIFLFLNLKELFFGVFYPILPKFLSYKLFMYTEVLETETLGLTFNALYKAFLTFIIVFFFYEKVFENKWTQGIFNIYFLGTIFYFIFNFFPQLSSRGSMHATQLEIIIIPLIISWLVRSYTNVLIYIVLSLYCFWGLNTILYAEKGHSFIPYFNLFF
jgi:hypothetical protein